MNAVVTLCHFCELHGPSVLFSTQAFHDATSLPSSKESKKGWYGPTDHLNRTTQNSDIKPAETCEGCTSFVGSPKSFISNDHDFKISYLSSQYPINSNVFSMVRHACVRSLSCEVCPGMEGPIYYGDEQRGHVLSHTFFLKDSQARGFNRWFSIIVVMMDKSYLLNNWNFLVEQIQLLIKDLQSKAKMVYKSEASEGSQRTIRLNSLSRITTPGNFRRQRGNVKGRSLLELTNEKDIFKILHAKFLWVLQALGSRISERLIEGLPSEDTIVDLEHQEKCLDGLETLSDLSLESGPKLNSLKHLCQLIGKENFEMLAYNVVVGSQIIIKGEPPILLKSLLKCLQDLLPHGCCKINYYSSEYTEDFNLLGLLPQVSFPSHAPTSFSNYVAIQVVASNSEQLSSHHFSMIHIPPPHDKVPQILNEIFRVIKDPNFPPPALEKFLIASKANWMNKVKVLFAFSQSNPDDNIGISKLHQVFGIQPQDHSLVKFWEMGLSHQYKNFVSSTSMAARSDL